MIFARAISLGLLLAATPGLALAQGAADRPSQPVKILVPFAPGGATDVVARILGELLSARWNEQSVVVENRPGPGTS